MNQFDGFPTGKRRKEIIADNDDGIADFKVKGKNLINYQDHYTILDSEISGNESFEDSFKYVLPAPGDLRYYIQKTLEKRKMKAIGVEFGGVGSNLFAGFSDKFFAKSIGVTLVDHREKNIYPEHSSKEDDDKINHEVLVGDIFNSKTYESLNEKLNGAKVDLIISRMLKGLEFVPRDPYTVGKVLQVWYKLLNENGIMLVQTPYKFNNLLSKWAEKIRKQYGDTLEIESMKGDRDNNVHTCSVFRLNKLAGAPDELPLLEPKVVRKTELY